MNLPSAIPVLQGTALQERRTGQTRSVCSYCGVGCGVTVTTTTEHGAAPVITKVTGDKAHPTNAGRLCTKGATHAELMATPGRMTTAFVRPERGQTAVATPVDDAVAEAARRLSEIIAEHGPDAVAVYVSGQMSIEAQYLANKLVKGYLRSIHIESNSRLCMASAGTGYKQSLGADGPPGSYDDFDAADLFFVIGSNTADCHPILYLRMAERLKAGARLIVVDPRRTATADRADLFLQIAAGTDMALLNGLLHLLVADGAIDEEFIADHTEGWAEMAPLLADYPPARVAEITGLAEDDIRTAARWIAEADEWMTLWTMGLNQSTQGTWHTNAICNLHLATGAIARRGSGPFSLTGQPNAMGGREMGYMGPGLPGQRSVLSADDRAFTEARWGLDAGTIRAESGTGTIEMYREMARGAIKAAWIICTNPVASVANRKTVIEGLESAELVIVQDVYEQTATAAYADILLPAALWVEADGVMVNSERTLTLVDRAVPAPGEALADWELICRVASAMGFDGFAFSSAAEVFDELREFWNPQTGWDVRGVDHERLRGGPVQWPAPPGDDEVRHPIRYLNDGVSQHLHTRVDGSVPRLAFATPSRRARFWARPHLPPAELPDDAYPFILNTGRLQHQWHTMTKTGRIDKLNKLDSGPFVEIHPDDAARAGIDEGDRIEVASRRGHAVLPAVITERVRPGALFAPFHWNDEHGADLTVNALTSDAVDAESLQPAFKYAAVAVQRVGPALPPSVPATGVLAPSTLRQALAAPTAPAATEAESMYLTGYLTALTAVPAAPATAPALPADAPLSPALHSWFDGMLAGAFSRVAAPLAVAETPVGSAITIVWASQTGNAEAFAATCAAVLTSRGLPARAVGMGSLRAEELADLEHLLVVTSTFGDGGPPDNGSAFWDELSAASAPSLDGLQYSVLAMGDSSYADFCGHGRSIDDRLAQLGATALVDRVDCEPDDEAPASAWLERVLGALGADDAGGLSLTAIADAPVRFSKASPVPALLVANELLSRSGSQKEVRRLGFDISGAGVTYAAGDSLGVFCANDPAMVDEWLRAAGLTPSAIVDVDGTTMLLSDALLTRRDITRITPEVMAFVVERSIDPSAARLTSRDNRARLDQYLWGKHLVDLLHAFPVSAAPDEWLAVMKKLQPRQYSISSSPKSSPDLVELTASIVRFETDAGARRGGVASTHLADRASALRTPIFLQRSSDFHPPVDPATPMIMVGPGTGVAPFRGFLHDRRADGATGRNWLFFGEQRIATDFYYRDEFEGMRSDGFLTRLDVAFSRDQRQKIYVQDRMREHGAELWRWLADGAHFYVCGDAERMAKDVDATLLEIARVHGGLDEAGALDFRKRLVADGRYVRDVY